MRTVGLVSAVLRTQVQVVDVVGGIVCTLPLYPYLGRGDEGHADVTHSTGAWLEERKEDGSLLMTIIPSSFTSKCLSRGLALPPSKSQMSSRRANSKTQVRITHAPFFQELWLPPTAEGLTGSPTQFFGPFCHKNAPRGGLLE